MVGPDPLSAASGGVSAGGLELSDYGEEKWVNVVKIIFWGE